MKSNKVQIPGGVRDYTGRDAYAKREIEGKLRNLFRISGFDEIETPVFEYSSIFMGEIGNVRQENMLRFFDTDGRTLALRPDFTMPVARVVSARKADFEKPVRVFYVGSAFGFEHTLGLRQRQFTQAGAELLGGGCTRADSEIILLAAQCIETLGISNYVLDIGHIGIFTGLAKEAGISQEQAEELRHCIDGKILPELQTTIKNMGISEEHAEAFSKLGEMYGGPEVLDEAEKVFTNEACQKAIGEMKKMLRTLRNTEVYDKLTIDLGLLPDINYYTGTVFRGMVDGISYQLLSGGRYDNVMEQFGRPMPATGFAMGVGWAMQAMEKQCGLPELPATYAVTGAERGEQGKAFAYANEQRAKGRRVVTGYKTELEDLIEEAKRIKAQKAVFFYTDGPQEYSIATEGE